MKKTTILTFAVLFTAIFNHSFGSNNTDSLTTNQPFYITTLVIYANVKVVLVDNDEATLEATGGRSFKRFVILEKIGDTLVISSARNRDYYNGIIYIPANQLRKIHINSMAHVESLFTLQIPKLDVIINGACDLNIANFGEVNLASTEDYSVEQSTKIRRFPASFLRKKA